MIQDFNKNPDALQQKVSICFQRMGNFSDYHQNSFIIFIDILLIQNPRKWAMNHEKILMISVS